MREAALALVCSVLVIWLSVGICLEFGYQQALQELGPLSIPPSRLALPAKVAETIWVDIAKSKPDAIPVIHGWNLHRLFIRNDRGLLLARQVAMSIAIRAHEQSRNRGMLHWHFKSMLATVWVTRNMSTDQILATISDEVYLAEHGRGFPGAARRLFHKELTDLDYPDIALLVTISRSPSRYDPFRHPNVALEARNELLRNLGEVGVLSETDLSEALVTHIGIETGSP